MRKWLVSLFFLFINAIYAISQPLIDNNFAEIILQHGHSGNINYVALNSTGSECVTVGEDGRIILWDVGSGKILKYFCGHSASVNKVIFSDNGKTIFSASDDGTVKQWDIENGNCLLTILVSAKVLTVGYSPNKSYLVTGTNTGMLDIWHADGGGLYRHIEGYFFGAITDAVWNPDSSQIAVVSEDKLIQIINPFTGKKIRNLIGHTEAVRHVLYSDDGKILYTGGDDKTVRFWSVADGKEIEQYKGSSEGFFTTIDKTGNLMATISENKKSVTIRSSDKPWNKTDLIGYESAVSFSTYSKDGMMLAIGSTVANVVRVIHPASGNYDSVIEGFSSPVLTGAFSDDCLYFLAGCTDGSVLIHKKYIEEKNTDWLLYKKINLETDEPIKKVAFLSSGKYVAALTVKGKNFVWNFETGEEIALKSAHESRVSSFCFSSDSKYFVTVSADKTVCVREIESMAKNEVMKMKKLFTAHKAAIVNCCFSPDCKYLITAAEDGIMTLWDAYSWTPIRNISLNDFESDDNLKKSNLRKKETKRFVPKFVLFVDEGKRLLISSSDAMQLRDVKTGKLCAEYSGHEYGWDITNVSSFNNFNSIVTSSTDGTVRFWKTGDAVANDKKTNWILQLQVYGNEDSIAWTPEGYFSGTAWARQYLMHLVCKQRIIPLSFVETNYYKPEIVSNAFRFANQK